MTEMWVQDWLNDGTGTRTEMDEKGRDKGVERVDGC